MSSIEIMWNSLLSYPRVYNKWASEHPDSQNYWRMPRYLNLVIRRITMFYPSLYIDIHGTDAHRFWRTTRFNGMGIRRIAMFFPLIYTLSYPYQFAIIIQIVFGLYE